MSFNQPWHESVDRLERYATGRCHVVERHSIEPHLIACAECRATLAAVRPTATADDVVLQAITARIDRPRRFLHRSTTPLQVSLASPPLVAASALLAITLVVAVGLAAAVDPRLGVITLVAIAPVAPAAAAMVAFWSTTDPAGSLSIATPLASGRLPFYRAAFATTVSALTGLLCSAFTPLAWSESIVWLAPGFAFAAAVLAAATWFDPLRLTMTIGASWLLVCALWARGLPRFGNGLETISVNDLATNRTDVQLACLAIVVIAGVVTAMRRTAQPNWRTA